MALIRGSMVSPDGKITYATVEHHKVNVPTREEHLAQMKAISILGEEEGKAKL
jgi:acyl-coenzyme A thioesterase 13